MTKRPKSAPAVLAVRITDNPRGRETFPFAFIPVGKHTLDGGDFVKRMKLWGAILLLAGILIRPESAVAGAQRAMRLWCSSVAPAMFPFLALLPILTGPDACAAYDVILSRVMRPLFNLPGSAAPALVIGMISGSPGGALAVRRVAVEAGLRRSEARRIALALGGVSPAYLILGVGQGLYGSVALGIRLALIQIVVQIGLLLMLRGIQAGEEEVISLPREERARGAIQRAVESALVICGYMVLFSSASCVAASFVGDSIGTGLLLVSDLPSGLAELARWEIPGKLLIQGAAIGFGGLCIAAQNLDALRPLGVTAKEYFSVRAIAAGAFGGISGFVLQSQGTGAEKYVNGSVQVYAFSLLIAGAMALPALFLLTKTFCFNNRKEEE